MNMRIIKISLAILSIILFVLSYFKDIMDGSPFLSRVLAPDYIKAMKVYNKLEEERSIIEGDKDFSFLCNVVFKVKPVDVEDRIIGAYYAVNNFVEMAGIKSTKDAIKIKTQKGEERNFYFIKEEGFEAILKEAKNRYGKILFWAGLFSLGYLAFLEIVKK